MLNISSASSWCSSDSETTADDTSHSESKLPSSPSVEPGTPPAQLTELHPADPKTPKPLGRAVANFTTPRQIKNHSELAHTEDCPEQQVLNADHYKIALAKEMKGGIQHSVKSLVDTILDNKGLMEGVLKKMTKQPREKIGENNVYYNSTEKEWNNWPPTNTPKTELQLSQYLNKVAKTVRMILKLPTRQDDLVFSSQLAEPGKGIPARFTNERRPDLIVIPRSKLKGKLAWSDVRAIGSLKVEKRERGEECSHFMEFARDCLSERHDRRFVLGIGFRHTKLTLYVFDRSGILTSEVLDVNEHPLHFLRVAIGILMLDHSQLGYDTSFFNEVHINEKGKKVEAEYLQVGERKYKVESELYVDQSIRGRGTVCLQVRRMDGRNMGKVCVVKDAWVDRSRAVKEVEMLEYLNELKVANVPKLIAHEIVQVTVAAGERVDDSTMIFRDATMKMEIRDHHRLVIWPCGAPFSRFSSLLELVSATLDIVETIEVLDKNDILHRDISMSNLILVPVKGSNIRKGYLIDFDYAIKNKEDRIIAKGKRTGTLPFMAIDILEFLDIEHNVIYDLESVLYVLIWIAFLYSGPNGQPREMTKQFHATSILKKWSPATLPEGTGLSSVADTKGYTMELESMFEKHILLKKDPFFLPLDECLLALRSALFPPRPKRNSKPLTAIAPEDEIKGMTHRVKECVFEGMKKTLKETKEALEGSASGGVIQHALVNAGQVISASNPFGEDIQGRRLRHVVEEEQQDPKGQIAPKRAVEVTADSCSRDGGQGSDELEGVDEIEKEKDSGSNSRTTHLISGQTLLGSSGNPVSRSNGKRPASVVFNDAVQEPVIIPAARPHKRSRTSRSQTLCGSGSDNVVE